MSVPASLAVAIGVILLAMGIGLILIHFHHWIDRHPMPCVIFAILFLVALVTFTVWGFTNP